jgi:hypothetical protein
MYSEFASELWSEIKTLVNTVDKQQAADVLVSLLIDFDENIEDIKQAFKGDELVKNALLYHIEEDIEDEYQDEDEDDLNNYDD